MDNGVLSDNATIDEPNVGTIYETPMFGTSNAVDHPSYYGGEDNPYEAIKVIDAWGLDFCLGNVAKYISRAGKKDPKKKKEDLSKAMFYLKHEIEKIPTE